MGRSTEKGWFDIDKVEKLKFIIWIWD
jgi:hypothetical protein